jgi:hypothetical protein
MDRFVDGEHESSKEAKDQKEFETLTRKGYITRSQPTEYPRMLYKTGSKRGRIVKDAEAEKVAEAQGWGSRDSEGTVKSKAATKAKKE